jgi:type II secretory pathway pseudopilin PulG
LGLREDDVEAMPILQAAISGLHGFTLVETLAALGSLLVAAALAGNRLFQVLSFQTSFRDKAVATSQLRHSGSWFSGESLNAKAAWDEGGEPVDLSSASDSVTLSWTGSDGTNHSSTYQVSGDSFERDYGGRINHLASRAVADSSGFIHCGNLLTLELEVDDEPGNARQPVLWTYLRRR